MTLRMGASHCKPEHCLVYVHESSSGGDTMDVICHMTSHDHLIEKACEFTGGNYLSYITTLISLLNIIIRMMEI